MTVAICIKCGAFKFGAFSPCEKCGAIPESEDDLALSMLMSDHFRNREELEKIGQSIADGKELRLDPETREEVIDSLGIQKVAEKLKRMASAYLEKQRNGEIPPSGHSRSE